MIVCTEPLPKERVPTAIARFWSCSAPATISDAEAEPPLISTMTGLPLSDRPAARRSVAFLRRCGRGSRRSRLCPGTHPRPKWPDAVPGRAASASTGGFRHRTSESGRRHGHRADLDVGTRLIRVDLQEDVADAQSRALVVGDDDLNLCHVGAVSLLGARLRPPPAAAPSCPHSPQPTHRRDRHPRFGTPAPEPSS